MMIAAKDLKVHHRNQKTSGSKFFKVNNIYPKLDISEATNKLEPEVDVMTKKVMPARELSANSPIDENNPIVIQRSAASSPTYEEGKYVDESEEEESIPGVQRMEALDQSTATNHIPRIKYPWSDQPHGGYDYYLHTDAGTEVMGWVGFEDVYWCHGHSLGTYDRWSYSIYSGPHMRAVIHDEYNQISGPNVRAGDLAVWEPNFGHSAIFRTIVRNGGVINENSTILSTKNGPDPQTNMSLTAIKNGYSGLLPNSTVNYYRHV